jgi:hypothetical protein
LPSSRGRTVLFARFPEGNCEGLLKAEGMIGKMEASLKQGLKVFKERPSKKLKKGH